MNQALRDPYSIFYGLKPFEAYELLIEIRNNLGFTIGELSALYKEERISNPRIFPFFGFSSRRVTSHPLKDLESARRKLEESGYDTKILKDVDKLIRGNPFPKFAPQQKFPTKGLRREAFLYLFNLGKKFRKKEEILEYPHFLIPAQEVRLATSCLYELYSCGYVGISSNNGKIYVPEVDCVPELEESRKRVPLGYWMRQAIYHLDKIGWNEKNIRELRRCDFGTYKGKKIDFANVRTLRKKLLRIYENNLHKRNNSQTENQEEVDNMV